MAKNRRKFDNMTDHDLIVAHTVKIDTLCALIKSGNKQLELYAEQSRAQFAHYTEALDIKCLRLHGGIDDTHTRLVKKVDGKMDGVTFRWIVGVLIFIIISMAGVMHTDRAMISTNTQAIKELHEIAAPDPGHDPPGGVPGYGDDF